MAALDPVIITDLRRVSHSLGDVMHGMRAGDVGYYGFGEAYFTSVYAGSTKGWKKHTRMYLNLVVPVGAVRFFLLDEATGERLQFDIGSPRYARLTVPPGWWVAFRGMAADLNLVLNLASIAHDPDEAENAPLDRFTLE